MAGLAALGLLSGCASSTPTDEAAPPLVSESQPGKQLAIDGLWAVVGESSRVVQIDRGRIYLAHGTRTGVAPGSLLHTQIEQTGPLGYQCQAPRIRGPEIVWLDCELTLDSLGRLVATTSPSRRPDDPVRPEIVSYELLALADPIWFDAQREASEIVSAEDAHPPLPPLPPLVVRVEPPRPEPPAPVPEHTPAPPEVDSPLGTYQALVIGSGDYLYLPAVATAEVDADAIARTLEELYGFEVTNLRNPTLRQMLDALHAQRDSLTADDWLLIYYAGQGLLTGGRCTWYPVNATGDDPAEGLANKEIREVLLQIKANHVMVVADSCFTASTRREARLAADADDPDALSQQRARVVLSSGGLEPLQDGSGGGHSVFSGAVVQALRGNTGPLAGTRLFEEIQRIIPSGGSQSPEYADIVGAGHDRGDFLFVPVSRDGR